MMWEELEGRSAVAHDVCEMGERRERERERKGEIETETETEREGGRGFHKPPNLVDNKDIVSIELILTFSVHH